MKEPNLMLCMFRYVCLCVCVWIYRADKSSCVFIIIIIIIALCVRRMCSFYFNALMTTPPCTHQQTTANVNVSLKQVHKKTMWKTFNKEEEEESKRKNGQKLPCRTDSVCSIFYSLDDKIAVCLTFSHGDVNFLFPLPLPAYWWMISKFDGKIEPNKLHKLDMIVSIFFWH